MASPQASLKASGLESQIVIYSPPELDIVMREILELPIRETYTGQDILLFP